MWLERFVSVINISLDSLFFLVAICMVKSDPATHRGSIWGERRYSSYSFLTSALDRGEWSASCPGCALPPGKDPWYPCTRGWVGPRAGLDTKARGKIPCLCRGSNPGRPVHSQTLFWLSYPGCCNLHGRVTKCLLQLVFLFLLLEWRNIESVLVLLRFL
jgi:hypothetical protein